MTLDGGGKGLFVLRAFPFIVRLPLKAIKAQEAVKQRIQAIGQSMLEHEVHESKNSTLLSSIGIYLPQLALMNRVEISPFLSSLGSR